MASKMFYTLEEAAAKLGKSEEQVREMVAKGQLQEFRDRDRLMFKAEQVDLLASGGSTGSKAGDEVYRLADSDELEPLSLAGSGGGSAMGGSGIESTKEQTGISIFEAEETEEADPSAVTKVTPSLAGGSGLLAATTEGQDSAVGSELLQDAYGTGGMAAVDVGGGSGVTGGGALFEGGSSEPEAATPAPLLAAMALEPYDGPGSGLVGGLAFGAIVALGIGLVAAVMGLTGAGAPLKTIGDNMFAFVGAAAGVTVLAALIGFVLGRKS